MKKSNGLGKKFPAHFYQLTTTTTTTTMKKVLEIENALGRVTEMEVNLPIFAKCYETYHWISDIKNNQPKGLTIWSDNSISINNYGLIDALRDESVRIEANEFEYALSRAIGVIKGKVYNIREEVQP